MVSEEPKDFKYLVELDQVQTTGHKGKALIQTGEDSKELKATVIFMKQGETEVSNNTQRRARN